jgi:hypothetical protein
MLYTPSSQPNKHSACAYQLCCSVLHAGSDDAIIAGSAALLSGLDLQDSWSASGLAQSITADQPEMKPNLSLSSMLSMKPITTHVNVLLVGSGHYLGKAPYYAQDSGTADTDADSAAPVDLHAAFLEDPAAWATQLPPVLLP